MGQYVSRGGKQYYKGDDGKLYANFQGAAAARNNPNSVENMFGRGFVQTVQGIPSTVQGAFANVGALLDTPIMRAAVGAPQKGPYDDWLNAPVSSGPTPRTKLITSGDADLGGDPGRMFAEDRRGDVDRRPPLPGDRGRAPITSPNTTYQAADEEYRNLLAQYGGAPGISQLAGMTSLPTGFTPTGASKQASLKDYYAAQALQGNANLGTITSALTQGMQGAEASNMAAWAKANPGLAQQAYVKQMGAGQAAGPGGRDIGSFIGGVNQYADQGQASSDEAAFGTIANPVAPTTAWNQGAMVDANRGKDNLLPQQAAKTNLDGGAPALNTTAGQPSTWDKAAKFLNEITPFTRTLVGPGGLGNYGI